MSDAPVARASITEMALEPDSAKDWFSPTVCAPGRVIVGELESMTRVSNCSTAERIGAVLRGFL
jgi:hypothetical protein